MYNRYIPQSDGSYQRNHIPEKKHTTAAPPPPPPCPPEPEHNSPCKPEPVGSFLRQLLPKHFDTADLIVLLLILLMSGDNDDDRTTAMLTLVLYLFL